MEIEKKAAYCPHCNIMLPLAPVGRCPHCGAKLETITPAVHLMKPTAKDIIEYQAWLLNHEPRLIQ